MAVEIRTQAVTGVVAPEMGEARIRDTWPSVAANFATAALGQRLIRSIFLAPIGWLVMALPYFSKVIPFTARRYFLTNRRVRIVGGWGYRKTFGEVALADIDDVRIVTDSNSDFFRAATLQILTGTTVSLTLPGVPEPDAFRHAILNARNAWVPAKAKLSPFVSASAK